MSDKKITPVTNNESVLEFDPNAGLHRVYDWKPYKMCIRDSKNFISLVTISL